MNIKPTRRAKAGRKGKTMQKYKVYKMAFVTIEVEAENADEAERKADAASVLEWEVNEISDDYNPIIEEVED